MLPVLAKLLSDDTVREHVPHLLAELLKDNKDLQVAAADADAVAKLAYLLQQDNCPPQLKVQIFSTSFGLGCRRIALSKHMLTSM